MSSYRAEMLLLREALESVVTPEVATALLFDAIELSGRAPPDSLEAARELADGALTEVIRRKAHPEQAAQLLGAVGELLARALESEGGGLAIDVDVEDAWEDEDPTATRQMEVVRKPVPVLVLGANEAFADKLLVCLGADRVRAVPAADEPSFRKAVFAYAPLVVLVDGTSPPSIDPRTLTAMLHDLPTSAMPVLWGAESGWSRAVLPGLEAENVPVVTLTRDEGIEPLLDLVLSRYRGDA